MLLACLVAGTLLTTTLAQEQQQQMPGESQARSSLIAVPDVAQPTMPLQDVRKGMVGYGLTVFSGTKIEPFAVKVESVIPKSSPARGTIWITSDDPRLLVSGPVQGMSGSPIYLYDQPMSNEQLAKRMGTGGRLVGAFAFGYGLSKGCLAGVQPIAYMRATGTRVGQSTSAGMTTSPGSQPSPARAAAALARLSEALGTGQAGHAAMSPASRDAQARIKLFANLLDSTRQNTKPATASDGAANTSMWGARPTPFPQDNLDARSAQPLALPMAVGSADMARLLAPLMSDTGIVPVARGLAGAPSSLQNVDISSEPPGVNVDDVRIEPGSVLSIPLAFGDLDLSAAGTVTDVLPDGTVLGFGHPMFGTGAVNVPLATGYVYYVVPRLTTSFKMAGTLGLAGTISRDESPAVAGGPGVKFDTAPVHVNVDMTGHPKQSYSYRVVDHKRLTAPIAASVIVGSLQASQSMPEDNTTYLTATVEMTGNRRFEIDTIMAMSGAGEVASNIVPPLMTLMENEHERLSLTGMTVNVRVEPTVKIGSITSARVKRATVKPGETVQMAVDIVRYLQPPQTHTLKLKIPIDVPDGQYEVVISDAATYLRQYFSSRPHLMDTKDVDDLLAIVERITEAKQDRLYATIQLPQTGIAIGRQQLDQLPSSRLAMIATPSSTRVTPFGRSISAYKTTPMHITGATSLSITVQSDGPKPDNNQ